MRGARHVLKEIKDVLRGEGGGAYQSFPAVVSRLPGTLLWVHLEVGGGWGWGWSAGKGEGEGVRVRVRVMVKFNVQARARIVMVGVRG